MVTISQLSTNLKILLKQNNIDDYIFETRCILEHTLCISHEKMIANPDLALSDEQVSLVQKITRKRITGYPLQYILGEWEFFGLPFYVGEGVLIPRQDTETLVESVLNQVASTTSPSPHILDLCSGSGCIAIALEKHLSSAKIGAVEYSDKAMEYLTRNIELNRSKVTVYNGDVLNPKLCCNFKNIDIITSNPPYLTSEDMSVLQKEVSFEPEMALRGGADGLLFYREITAIWKQSLKKGGMIFFEIGLNKERDVSQILIKNGFSDIETYPDLSGIIRVVSGVYK